MPFWYRGIIPRCHRGDPGSIPGWHKFFICQSGRVVNFLGQNPTVVIRAGSNPAVALFSELAAKRQDSGAGSVLNLPSQIAFA